MYTAHPRVCAHYTWGYHTHYCNTHPYFFPSKIQGGSMHYMWQNTALETWVVYKSHFFGFDSKNCFLDTSSTPQASWYFGFLAECHSSVSVSLVRKAQCWQFHWKWWDVRASASETKSKWRKGPLRHWCCSVLVPKTVAGKWPRKALSPRPSPFSLWFIPPSLFGPFQVSRNFELVGRVNLDQLEQMKEKLESSSSDDEDKEEDMNSKADDRG